MRVQPSFQQLPIVYSGFQMGEQAGNLGEGGVNLTVYAALAEVSDLI
jgi:uncharacterized protein YdiU (UPF0061 family)